MPVSAAIPILEKMFCQNAGRPSGMATKQQKPERALKGNVSQRSPKLVVLLVIQIALLDSGVKVVVVTLSFNTKKWELRINTEKQYSLEHFSLQR